MTRPDLPKSVPSPESPHLAAKVAETLPAPAKPGKPGPKPRDLWRVHVTVPGILWGAVQQRWAEFFYRSFTPFTIELVCFDLRQRHTHDITQPIAGDPRYLQDANYRQTVVRYRPHLPRQFGLLDELLHAKETFEPDPAAAALPEVTCVPMHVKFPGKLRPIIEERWVELGYKGVGPYITGLIRYDLMLCGPHKHFDGYDTDPDLLKELDEFTEQTFRANRKRRIVLDYMIEEAAGRKMTDEERRAEMRKLAERLRVVSATGRRKGAAAK